MSVSFRGSHLEIFVSRRADSLPQVTRGRQRRRFQGALDALAVYQDLVAHLDEAAIRDVVEN
jgi:hypothetical protein